MEDDVELVNDFFVLPCFICLVVEQTGDQTSNNIYVYDRARICLAAIVRKKTTPGNYGGRVHSVR